MKKYQSNYLRIATIVAFLFVHQLLKAQWPQWRGPMRDGFCAESNLLKAWPAEGPRLAWSSDTIGFGYGSAIIQGNIIYATGLKESSEIMTAFDINGKIIWQKRVGKAGENSNGSLAPGSTPTFYKNKLYFLTAAGEIVCINPTTGALVWAISIPKKFEGAIGSIMGRTSIFCESPLVVDDKVILTPCGKNATFIALNSSTGETVWASESIDNAGNFVSPILIQGEGKKLIVSNTENFYVAVDLNTGKIVWKEKGSATSVPLPGNKQVYFTCTDDGGKMLNISNDLNSFSFKWSDGLKIKPLGGAVRLGNRIFGTYDNRKGILCIDWETGKQQVFDKDIRGASLLAANGMIYCYEDKAGRVSLLKPTENSIEIVGSFKVTMGQGAHLAHMSMGNGILFVRHGDSLMAYNIKQK
ncbi:MAG: hypothetical protein EHM93_13175 [Bacteroidales bacterium]|nr:MAG: hypothetical protein EHM93_13175 [Bacteroidales bacterium]